MATLRQLENHVGITRDETNLEKMYAEDWNEMVAKISNGSDSINTSEVKIDAVTVIDNNKKIIANRIETDTGAKVRLVKKGTITCNDTTFKAIETIPANGVIWNIYLYVLEEFTDGSVEIKTSTEETYTSLTEDLLTTGWKYPELDNIPHRIIDELAIGGIYTGTSETGILEVYIEYTIF